MTYPSFLLSIRARLAVLIVVAMAALVGLLVYQQIQKRSDNKARGDDSLVRLAKFAAQAERERFDSAHRLLVLAKQATSLRAAATTPPDSPDYAKAYDGCTAGLFVLDQLLPETSGFALWDTSGNILCSSKAAKRGEFTASGNLWFQTAVERQDFATGAYELSPGDNQPAIGFGLPIKDAAGTATIAYLSTGLRLSDTDELLRRSNLPDTGRIGVVDQNGIIINSSIGQSGQPTAGFRERFGSLQNFLDAKVTNGTSGRRVAAVRITDASDPAVTVAVGADQDALVGSLTDSLIKDLWPVALLTLLTLVALWLLGRRWIVKPVASLVDASDALAAGDLGARATVPPGVSEFERLAVSFNDMAEARERASHAKDEFLGLVSHELKTPITTVLGNAAILRDRGDRLDPEMRQGALDDIGESARRLSSIIDNLLALARLDRGAELESEPLAIQRMAQAAAETELRRAPGRRVLVRGDATLLALGGATYVEQVLQNLIGNAIKYSAADASVEVFVEQDGDRAVVRVCDRGRGIDESEREAVFQPFYRSARTAAFAEGVGIGLSVCKRLTEAMGGTIWCSERPGGGCEFGFTLPLITEASPLLLDEDEPFVAAAATS